MYIRFTLLLISCFTSFYVLSQSPLDSNYQTFNFWVGEWDVFANASEEATAQSKIEPIADGFALLENYSSLTNSFKGKSLNKYNPNTGKWEQFWVDNAGTS